MNKKTGFSLLILVLILFYCPLISETMDKKNIALKEVTGIFDKDTLTLKSDDSSGKKIIISLEQIKFPKTGLLKDFLTYKENGCGNMPFDSIVSYIKVNVNERPICISKSAIIDLYDPYEITLKTYKNNLFELIICGSSHGGGYCARLKFDNGRLIEREWEHNECGLVEKIYYYEGCK